MIANLVFALGLAGTPAAQEPTPDAATVVVVVGAEGQGEFGTRFSSWAERWDQAATSAAAELTRIGPGSAAGGDTTDRERLRERIAALDVDGSRPVWIVLLGHGTFDGQRAKFNLRGPDVSAIELAEWLEPVKRPTAVVVCAASSSPFLVALSRPGRMIVTATRSGIESSFSYFGEHLSSAIVDPAADLDKDRQVSLLEAFLFASAGVAEFYDREARLATEHPLLDDNGDGLGTPATWFRGVRSTREAKDGLVADGIHAKRFHLVPSAEERSLPPEVRARRDGLELEIEQLRTRKAELGEEVYYGALEELLLELARLYETLDR